MNHREKAATSLLTGALAAKAAPEGEEVERVARTMLGDQIGGALGLAAILPHLYQQSKDPAVMGKSSPFRAFKEGHPKFQHMPATHRLKQQLKVIGRMAKNPKGIGSMLAGSGIGALIGYHST